jgi:hypothetical protein
LGYRYLLENKQQLYGIYGAYDHRKTDFGNYFCWFNHFFIGANFYQPIGSAEKLVSTTNIAEYRDHGAYKNL